MICEIKNLLKRVYYNLKYRKNNVRIEKGTDIGGWHTVFEGCNKIGENTKFRGAIGYGSYISDNCEIYGSVGRFTSIAPNVKVVAGTHPTQGFVSTHPCFYSDRSQSGISWVNECKFEEMKDCGDGHLVHIGNDVWIGYGAIVLQGIKIGDGAVIAAGAVVTKDVPPYTIVGGVPAKEIKKRFSEEYIAALCQFKWWDKDISWIKDNCRQFENVDCFVETMIKSKGMKS